ncbi:MAG: ferredoxin--NADP reductase [Betaproteobacteria bacterium]|nr:ferredoxin--NADP reductase [Betaproteobacteria bacterium]
MSSPSEDKFTCESITWIHAWTPHLFSFKTSRPRSFRFTAGQFARLGVQKADGSVVWRAYSMVSGPYDEHLEFYSIVVPGGEFTTELAKLRVGDPVFIDKQNHGFLTLSRFSDGTDLWLLSTGTGIAPFLSILSDPDVWQTYARIVLVHSVRTHDELAYEETIRSLSSHEIFGTLAHKLTYIPVITRQQIRGLLNARITTLIENGALEQAAGLRLDLDNSRIMLCGNPEMVDQTRQVLKRRGFKTSRQSSPGQIAVENYW